MSVLPSFKHAFKSIADQNSNEPPVADDSNFAYPSSSPFETTRLHPNHDSLTKNSKNSNNSNNPNNNNINVSTALPTTTTTTTVSTASNASRPYMTLLPLDHLPLDPVLTTHPHQSLTAPSQPQSQSDVPSSFSYGSRSNLRATLDPLPLDRLGLTVDENPYLSVRPRGFVPLLSNSTAAPHKRRRPHTADSEERPTKQPYLDPPHTLPFSSQKHSSVLPPVSASASTLPPPAAEPTFGRATIGTTGTNTTNHNPTPAAINSTAPKLTLAQSLPRLSTCHTTRSTDRLSSLSDALRNSTSPPNNQRDRPSGADGVSGGRSPDDVNNGSNARRGIGIDERRRSGTVHSAGSLFRNGSLRLGPLLDGASHSPSIEGFDTVTMRRGSVNRSVSGTGHLFAFVEDSTGKAPVDVLSIPGQRSAHSHSALSGRTLQLAGVGVTGSAAAGIGSSDLMSMAGWPTTSEFSLRRTTISQGEDGGGGEDNRSDLVDGTDGLAAEKAVKKVSPSGKDVGKEEGQLEVRRREYEWGVSGDATCETMATTVTTAKTTKGEERLIGATTTRGTWSPKNVTDGYSMVRKEDSVEKEAVNEGNLIETMIPTAKPTVNESGNVSGGGGGGGGSGTGSGSGSGLASASASGSGSGGEVEEDLVQCPHCPRRLRNQVTLQNHIRVVHHNNGNFQCSQCGLTFMWRSTLGNHVRLVHEKQRPYACDECGKAFRWKSHLREHFWVVHKGEKPFECKTCGKTFGRKNNMQKHMRKHEEK